MSEKLSDRVFVIFRKSQNLHGHPWSVDNNAIYVLNFERRHTECKETLHVARSFTSDRANAIKTLTESNRPSDIGEQFCPS